MESKHTELMRACGLSLALCSAVSSKELHTARKRVVVCRLRRFG